MWKNTDARSIREDPVSREKRTEDLLRTESKSERKHKPGKSKVVEENKQDRRGKTVKKRNSRISHERPHTKKGRKRPLRRRATNAAAEGLRIWKGRGRPNGTRAERPIHS